MRKIFLCALIVLAVISSAYAAEAKSLILIFSRADENYRVGYITVGNTMKLAQIIEAKTGAEMFEIKPEKKYPADYDTCIDVAKKEQNANARPAFLEDKDITEYDTIYFGYPVWWGDIPMCLYTFIEAHDWNGKTIIPFCTSEGSGMGRTERTLRSEMKGAKILKGLYVSGSAAQRGGSSVEGSVDRWLRGLGL